MGLSRLGIGLLGVTGRIIILIIANNILAIKTPIMIIAMMALISLEESSNFDGYLKELGVGFILRQLAQVAQPTVTVDRWTTIL